jgi:ribosomal protein S18 acetylase RimI-like enzyme
VAHDFSDDPGRLDVDAAWRFLSTEAYWGRWRSRSDFERQVASAWRVVGCYADDGAMVGFCRAISDGVGFAYLADVYVLPDNRGAGLGRRMVQVMVEDGPGRDFRWLLHTADAHGLYAQFGFAAPDETLLERRHGTERHPGGGHPPEHGGRADG